MFRVFWRRLGSLPTTACSTCVAATSTATTTTTTTTTTPTSYALILRNPLSTAVSGAKDPCFTVSYLMNSCGLSSEAAITTAGKLHLKTTENPDHVLQTLKDYGFSRSQISRVVTRFPTILRSDPDKIIKPKLEYFRSAGFAESQLTYFLSTNPTILRRNLERKIIPSVDFLKAILPSIEYVSDLLSQTNQSVMPENANINILRNHGVGEAVILTLCHQHPRSLTRNAEGFVQIVNKVKEMGFHPESKLFAHGIGVMCYMSDSTWNKKVSFYRSLGWSENDFLMAFRKQPFFMASSEKDIQEKFDFFVNKFGLDPSFFVARPRILKVSLKSNLIPRYTVLQMLLSRGLIKSISGVSVFIMSNTKFFNQYVDKYKEEIPQLVDAYRGKLVLTEGGRGWEELPHAQ